MNAHVPNRSEQRLRSVRTPDAVRTGGHVFVDESKQGDYLLIATRIAPAEVGRSRQTVRTLILPGQSRLHMKPERPARKHLILSTFERANLSATIFRAGASYKTQIDARLACLESLIRDATEHSDARLCLELDQTLVARDRRALTQLTKQYQCNDLEFRHERAAQEPLLAVPDGIGWAWARGGDFRRRAQPMVVDVIDV
ncbi:hypothetical protein ACFT2C_03155 [Promicromonospora sp. NPDC057138]|uniref:hypothetical protein n=1 Tax=Promicromonospora sp. NPDC057138 TaxID=3346031 RepID=UPI00362F0BF7